MATYPPSTKEQVGAALQAAGQYSGGSTVWTPGNAEELGLDPSRGYVAKGTPTDAPQPPTPIEPKPPSMAPGLGTTGGGPSPVRQEAPLPPAPSQQSQQNGALPKGFIPDEGKEGKAGLLPKGFIPDEQKEEEKPLPKGFVSEEEHAKEVAPPSIPQKPGETAPVPPVQAAAPPAAQVPTAPDQNVLYRSLVDQGYSPGSAQSIAAGQEPKTLTGETPPPKPKPPAPKPAPQDQQQEPVAPVPKTVDWHQLGYKSFEDYQNFVNTLGIHTAVRGAGTTATLTDKEQTPPTAEAKPSTTAPSTTTKGDEKPAVIGGNRLKGIVTSFGLNPDGSIDADDNGIGFFGGVNTRNPHLRAVAVPVDVLEGIFGKFTRKNAQGGYDALDTPEAKAIIAKIRSAHVEVPDANGKIHQFPIVDIQGSLGRHPGKVLDMTFGAMKEMGYTDNHAASYQIIGGDGKPYPIPDIELTRGGKDGGPAAGPAVGPGGPAGPWISVGGAPSGGGAAPEFRGPPVEGGGGAQPDYSPSESRAEPISLADLGGLLTGAAAGAALRGGPQAAQPSEEKGPSPSDVVAKVLAAGVPPPAPGATKVDLSTMKPANVLSVRTPQLGLPAPPAAPSAAAGAPDPSVIKGLMKAGFTLEQANAFAAKARVSKPGAAIAGGASFRKPAQLPAPPAAPARQPSVAAAKPPPQPPSTPQAPPLREATGIGPKGSTVGVPNPPGGPSPDDPRVKKQKDNLTKGEHFVPGDDFHDQLLAGLPGGHGGRQRQILAQAEQAIADKRPLHLSYLSAPREAAKFPTRESRTTQYAASSPEARLLGTTEAQLVGHSFIPTAVGVSPSRKEGEPHQSYIQGVSTNIIANNFAHANAKLAAMGEKSPYANFGPKFANDLEGYLHNLIAGHTGTGRSHAVGTAEYPNEPDTSHVPYKLTRREADFLNLTLNNTAAFAKDAQALRELARVNGTLVSEAGETNPMRHQIEQHEPGWRQRVLEPSIRSFKTGLIHEVHPDEGAMPMTIRPGEGYKDLTAAMARTSHRGRPDVPVAASLHSTFAQNKEINRIERDFSDGKISEAEAHERLRQIGEDPSEYKFVSGSGGLVSPYEDDGEAISPEEHATLKNNLRKKWIGGALDVENYRKRVAEVPLPTKPSTPEEGQGEPGESPSSPVSAVPRPATSGRASPGHTVPSLAGPSPDLSKSASSPPPEAEVHEEKSEALPKAPEIAPPVPKRPPKAPKEPPAAPEPAAAPPIKPKKPELEEPSPEQPKEPELEPEETEPTKEPPTAPPAPGDILPPAKKPKKAAKTKEQSELEAQDFEQAAADRDNISPEDAGRLARIQKLAKGWVKKNPILHGLSMHAYLTGQKKFPGKLKKEQIGEHFDATNPKLDYSNEEHRQMAADAVVHDIMHSLAGTTTGKPSTAYGWYDRTVRKTMAKIGQIAPEILTDPDHAMAFKLALAITSQGQDVFPNAESAWHIYQHWLKSGEMPTSRNVFGGGIKAQQMEENLAKVNDLWKTHGTEGLHKILMSRMTSRELKQKYGLDSGEKADYEVNGAMGLGPKIGAFFSNLNGDFDPTTIDLWFSRNMNLMAGNMFGFSDKAMRQDRMEKGELVKSHLSQLKDLLDSGMVSVPQERAAKMSEELGKLQAHPQGKLDRAQARELAPEIYDWARERHNIYQKSDGYEGSYHRDLKTPENLTGKKLDEAVKELSDDPRTATERDHWRDIMARADQSLKANKVHLTNADKQALLWFDIKDLFKMAGSPQRPKADYLDAAHRLVRKVKSGELPGLKQANQPFSGGVLKMQGGGFVPGDFTSMVAGQPMSESDAPRAMPVVPKAQPAQTPAVTTGPATLSTGSSNANSASQLGDLRARIAQEFQANPDARQKLINSVYKEVQDQPQAWLPYIESAMNRSVARNKSLVYTIDPTLPKAKRYFPYDAWPKQAPEDFAKKVNPLIDQALQGSNMAGYATGNESEDVKSQDAPIAFDPGTGERFIIEEPDLEWASKRSPIPILSTRSE